MEKFYLSVAIGKRAKIEMPKELAKGGILLAGHGGLGLCVPVAARLGLRVVRRARARRHLSIRCYRPT